MPTLKSSNETPESRHLFAVAARGFCGGIPSRRPTFSGAVQAVLACILALTLGVDRTAASQADAAYRILDSDIVPVTFQSDDAGPLDLWIPAAFDNSQAHERIFGHPSWPTNFSTLVSRDHRIDIYERVILHLCFQPQGDSLGWEEMVDLIAESAAEVGEPLSPEVKITLLGTLKSLETIGKISKAGALIDKAVIAGDLNGS